MNTFKAIVSTTDSRKVIDLAVPGYAADDITVGIKTVTNSMNKDKKDTLVTVKGKYTRPVGATGKAVKRFSLDKEIPASFKEDILIEGDFDISKTAYTVANGVVRISVPKTVDAIGAKIAILAADKNINALSAADSDDDDANA